MIEQICIACTRLDPKFKLLGYISFQPSYMCVGKPNPVDTVENLIKAINRGDVDAALSLYEPSAVLIAQPGSIAQGKDAIRTAIEGFVSLKPTLTGIAHRVIEAGDVALFCSRWTLVGTSPDGKRVEMGGTSSDVLRRQADGRWLVAVDNPWGTAILDHQES